MIRVNKEDKDGFRILELIGELDASSSLVFDNEIQNAIREEIYYIVVDCSNLNYISSAGLGVFISNMKTLTQNSGKFVLYGVNDTVFQVFKMLGLNQLLEIQTTLSEAEQIVNA